MSSPSGTRQAQQAFFIVLMLLVAFGGGLLSRRWLPEPAARVPPAGTPAAQPAGTPGGQPAGTPGGQPAATPEGSPAVASRPSSGESVASPTGGPRGASSEKAPAVSASAAPDTGAPPASESSPLTPTEPAPASATAPKPADKKLPWQAVLESPEPPRPFTEVCFGEFDLTRALTQREELLRWFAPITPNAIRSVNARGRHGQCGAFDGVVRLQAPWLENTALRLALDDYNRLQIHCYRGAQGVALVYYEDDNQRWAAYAMERSEGTIPPRSWALTATDDGRARRTEIRLGGPIELRYHAGELILTRGDVRLLAAPLDGVPDEVLFVGKAAVQGIELVKSLPPEPGLNRIRDLEPLSGNLRFVEELPEASGQVERAADGSVTLAANQAKARTSVAIPLGEAGCREWVVELAGVTPGTGIHFTRDNARPVHLVRFVADRTSGGLGAVVRGDDDSTEHAFPAIQERPVPFVRERVWLRFVVGCGVIRWWLSSDGVHWADSDEPMVNPPGGPNYLAIHCAARVPEGRITLRQIASRPLDELAVGFRPDVAAAVPDSLDASSVGHWTVAMLESLPRGVDFGEWRRACIWKTLCRSPSPDIGWHLVQVLLDDEQVRRMPLFAQLRLHERALEIFNLRDQPHLMTGLVQRCQTLATESAPVDAAANEKLAETKRVGYSSVRHALQTMPLSPRHAIPIVQPAAIRQELLELVYSRSWRELADLSRTLKYFHWDQPTPLWGWAAHQASRALPAEERVNLGTKAGWRHPLSDEVRKEVFNFTSELDAALELDNLADAGRLIALVDPAGARGLASLRDEEQYASLPVAIRQTFATRPELRAVMAREFSELAQLRLRDATQHGDVARVAAVATQFEGTAAAAEGRSWLAHRSLMQGWFDEAVEAYRQLGENAAPDSRLRLRLAAAALGKDLGVPATANLSVGGQQLGPEELEKTVADLRQRAASASTTMVSGTGTLPGFSGLLAQPRSRLDGLLGENPDNEGARQISHLKIPWADRQLAGIIQGNLAYVSNRFQVSAYDLASGQRVWQSGRPTEKMLRSQDWVLTPMVPLVRPGALYTRMLYGLGPMLVCLDRADGKLKWTAEQKQNEELASDAWWGRGRLYALSIARSDQQDGELRLTEYDPSTGYVIDQKPILRVRDTWWQRRYLRVTADAGRFFVALGGGLFCCDLEGQLLWLRKETVLPPDEEPGWVSQAFDPPRLMEGRLFTAQPGSRAVHCLEAETGRLLWRTVIPNLRRIVTIDAGLVLVESDEGWAGLTQDGGKLVWKRSDAGVLEGVAAGDGRWLSVRKVPLDKQASRHRLQFVWSDMASGRELATAVAEGLDDPDPRLGMLLPASNRLWAFFGRGQNAADRDFVEFAPQGDAIQQFGTSARPFWTRHIPEPIQNAAGQTIPNWHVIQGEGGERTGALDEAHGEREVLGIRIRAGNPVVFARQFAVPPDATPRLRLRLGNDLIQAWRVEVRWNGRTIWQQELQEVTHPQRWKDLEAALPELIGQSGWLTVRAQLLTGGDGALTYWKRMEIVL